MKGGAMKRFEVWFREDHVKAVESTASDLGISPAELILHLAVIGMAQLNATGRAVRMLRNQVLELAALRKAGRIDAIDYAHCIEEIHDLDDPAKTAWTSEV
jgi:hypothetical protein